MKYLLDTNVLSESVKTSPQNTVLKSIERHQYEIVTAAPVWHELYFGCQRLPASRKRQILENYLNDIIKPNMIILPYDERAAGSQSFFLVRQSFHSPMPEPEKLLRLTL
jgi:tRNA(fMet)-specific endonuclease VapC